MLHRSGVICFGAQVDHRRVLAELELLKPGGALAQPPDLINEALGDQLSAGQFLIATAVGIFRRRPAIERAQLAQGRVETVEVGRGLPRYHTDVEPGRIWFEGGVGPITVPRTTSDLACPGSTMHITAARLNNTCTSSKSASCTPNRAAAGSSTSNQLA